MTRASLNARVEVLVRAAQRDAEMRAAAPLSHDIARLSRAFTTEQAHRRPDYMADPRMRRAYLAFFVPQYAAKVAQILERYADEGLLKLPQRPRVLDVGAGPLTGTMGAALYAGELGPSTAIDLARAALEAGAQLARSIGVEDVTLVEASLVGPLARVVAATPVDLVIVAHVLNELGDPRRAVAQRAQLLTHLVQQLAPGGRLLVVEPGTRVHGRAQSRA